MLGLLPQELLGTSMYEYYHVDDINSLTEVHKSALQTTETVTTAVIIFWNCHVLRYLFQIDVYIDFVDFLPGVSISG